MMSGARRFHDRAEAGRLLGERLGSYAGRSDVVVLALPRGGVPVAREVARALGAPLDVFLVRKLGFPGQPELAMGAIASGGTRVLNEDLVRELRLDDELIERVAEREATELARREQAYRGGRPPLDLRGHTVVLVDDGLATGATMRAAVAAIRSRGPRLLVVAVPTAPPHALDELRPEVDELVWMIAPEQFHAVGLWYDDFREVSDGEVSRLLAMPREDQVDAGGAEGNLVVPVGARGLVLFAHGSGSSRFSPRNRYVAGVLEDAGLATLLVDLLTRQEERLDLRTRALRFDIELLAERLLAAAAWAAGDERTRDLRLGLFGASTGAGAAVVAAAREPDSVRAVVSRGGRPDLAGPALADLRAPTLLVVGGHDELVLDLNRRAMAAMTRAAVVELEVVPGATHLFEEAGALERVAELACHWFARHLTGG
jgi:putative phosphoribosyl transferase